MNIFVTGATGLLGGNIVQALLDGGHEVTALVRSSGSGGLEFGPDVRWVVGDIRAAEQFEAALQGSDGLIHAAAYYGEFHRPGGREEVLHETNVQGTLKLLEAAVRAEVPRIVYVSSNAVLAVRPGHVVDESCPYPDAPDDPYFRSKIDAEKAVLQFGSSHPQARLVLILPSMMTGPGDRGPTPFGAFVLNVLTGSMEAIPPGAVPLTDARDVAQAAIAALIQGRSGERYIVSAPRVSLAEIVKTLGEVTGRPVPTRQPPAPVINTIARVMELMSKVTGKPAPIKLAHLRRLQQAIQYDAGKAQRELNARFRPLPETLRDTADWFESHGYLGTQAPRHKAAA